MCPTDTPNGHACPTMMAQRPTLSPVAAIKSAMRLCCSDFTSSHIRHTTLFQYSRVRPSSLAMFSKTVAVVAALAASVVALPQASPENVVVTLPDTFKQCERSVISWEGGIGSFFVEFLEHSQIIEAFAGLGSNALTWNTNIRAGTELSFFIRDAFGHATQTPSFTIQPGTDDCILVN
ncbi:hypothetical protein C8Q77DRAFT_1112422 [Trametes polyzona]|nr:hypothetical protein C8Q77DRAFT_1112422 [Trametes polyzona]